MVSNEQFLAALFKEDAPFVHVTDFMDDPNEIPANRHLQAWAGNWFSRYRFTPGSNQYFTISIFNPDETGRARRRKTLYLRTRVIVLDDVKEKLSLEAASLLPPPSWILETSPGSEQWGYILETPCHDRSRVENLLDGLVANGLAPEGRDPGMKGVTRYVRLPDGYNRKASKMVNGEAFKCRLVEWHPERTTTLEALASPFHVNLDVQRREGRLDGAAAVPDHPILQVPDVVRIKEVRSDGRFDITCPWVDEHTNGVDNGTGIFTNDDGTLGFKCHHGACESRTTRDFVRFVEQEVPGFAQTFSSWRTARVFADVLSEVPPPPKDETVTINSLMDQLSRMIPGDQATLNAASKVLQLIESLPEIERVTYHHQVAGIMGWTKPDFVKILKDLRRSWYQESKAQCTFYDSIVYVKELNQFYDTVTGIFFSPDGFANSFMDQDLEARKEALQNGRVTKVDKLDFAPKRPLVFSEDGMTYGNLWTSHCTNTGREGDASPWLNHFDVLGWGDHKKHVLQWMAHTLRHPDIKINHVIMLGGAEGVGKDFLLYPLIEAMGRYAKVIDGYELTGGFNDYLLAVKYLHVNETELGDHHMAREVSNKLKPLATAPPKTLRVNQKGIRPITVRNIVNCSMTTNSQTPVNLQGPSRRFFALWSELNIRDEHDDILQEWREYWTGMWNWMNTGGMEYCIWYLYNRVDLSDFNPGQAPPMTEFLRTIQDASKPSTVQTVEAFIEARLGAFACDIATLNDMVSTLRSSTFLPGAEEIMYADPAWFTPVKLRKILSEMSRCSLKRIRNSNIDTNAWIIRHRKRYNDMSQKDLADIYEQQRSVNKRPPLQVVK